MKNGKLKELVKSGKIPIICRASVELVKEIKKIFGNQHIDVKILGNLPDRKKMKKEEEKRAGKNFDENKINEIAEKRLKLQGQNAEAIEAHKSANYYFKLLYFKPLFSNWTIFNG